MCTCERNGGEPAHRTLFSAGLFAQSQPEWRLWKFVKKPCLYSKYDADFATFKAAMVTCLSETHTQHKSALDSLLTWRFQIFEKAQLVPV